MTNFYAFFITDGRALKNDYLSPFTKEAMNKIINANYLAFGALVDFYHFLRRHGSLRVGSNPDFGNFFFIYIHTFFILILCEFSL